MQTELEHPRQLGRYELQAVLGKGGMGIVYEAVMHGLAGFRKRVALKVLAPTTESDDAAALAGLQREARLGALLSHPNVVSILDLGRSGDQWYIAMELVSGLPVSTLVRSQPLTGGQILDIGLMAAAGLAHIHDLRVDGSPGGLVHRDVKPQNLLVDENGIVKLADFGIASLVGSSDGSNRAGTPTWMAPEQHEGRVDRRADLFALGCVLYACTTRRAPFGTGVRAASEVQRTELLLRDPAFLAPVEQAIPGLGEVVRHCLRCDPADRWPDAHALGAALRAVRAGFGPSTLSEAVSLARGVPVSASGPTGRSGSGRSLLPEVDPLFIGRSAETQQLLDLAGLHRMVTVVGPGGVGKTRLALQLCASLSDKPGGGVVFVDLSGCRRGPEVVRAVAERLGSRALDHDEVGQVGASIAGRGPLTLVLDGAEVVAQEVADLIGRWSATAPEARFVVTSRLPLRVRAERVLVVEPLPPAAGVELYLARSGRTVTSAAERQEVEALVEALDGLPLAIELAAARSRWMTPGLLLERMSHRFRLLVDPSRTGGRHTTLKASIEVSWTLLRPFERSACSQLAVFVGGFTVEAAEGVLDFSEWPEAPWALDVLSALVDASLLHFDPVRQRFRMANSIREYTLEVAEPALLAHAKIRHGEWYSQLGSPESMERAASRGGEVVRDAMAADFDNVVVACERAIERKDPAVAGATGVAAGELFRDRGPLREGNALLDRVLALDGVANRSRLLAQRYGLRSAVGRTAEAVADLREALVSALAERNAPMELAARGLLLRHEPDAAKAVEGLTALAEEARRRGEPRAEARARTICGTRWIEAGDAVAARREQELALAGFRRLGDERGLGLVELRLGRLDLGERRYAEALKHFQEAERHLRDARDHQNLAQARENTAVAHFHAGRTDTARELFEELLVQVRRYGDRSMEANLLANLAVLEKRAGRFESSRNLNDQAARLARALEDGHLLGRVLGNLAVLSELLGQHGPSREARREAVSVLRSNGQEAEASWQELSMVLDDPDATAEGVAAAAARTLPKLRGTRSLDAVVALADVWLELGRPELAEERLRVARREHGIGEGDPADAALRILEARVDAARGRPAQASTRLGGLREDENGFWAAWVEVALAAGDLAGADRALEGVRRAVERSGAQPGSAVHRGWVRLRARVDAARGRG